MLDQLFIGIHPLMFLSAKKELKCARGAALLVLQQVTEGSDDEINRSLERMAASIEFC
jgi:hypothetical protein